MNVKKEVVEKVTISYRDEEHKDVVEFCSNGGYSIVDTYSVQDGRSLKYTGESVIVAEKKHA